MITTVLLDDGGVMNDNSRRGSQWKKLIGDFFIPRFGGTPKQWAAANHGIVEKIMRKIGEMYDNQQDELPEGYYTWENEFWIDTMFEHMGLPSPDNKVELSIEASKWITPQVDSSYPGVIETIHRLAKDYVLYTASNEVSYEIEGYLKGMGVAQHFSGFFGADLLNALKTSPLYYRKLIEKTGILPNETVVIDDSITNLEHAKSEGFHVIHSGLSGEEPNEFPYFDDPTMIPDLILELS